MALRMPREVDLSDIVILSDELHIDRSSDGLLGRGGYGLVYRGSYKEKKVAVKMLSDDGDIPKTQRNDLRKEARRLRASCDHPNILNLVGVVMETNNYSLVLEYMHFGTCVFFVKHYLVRPAIRIQFAQQIISAMAWLHAHDPPIKHLDLKAENVLINNYFIAKISDFGLSQWKTVTMAFSKTQPIMDKGPRCGTLSHIPPEVFRDVNKKGSVEEDVYAFGVTLWEIFSGCAPFKGLKDNLVIEAVVRNQRPSMAKIIKDCPREIKDMIQVSWDHNPDFRPSFEDLEEKISPVYNSVKSSLHAEHKYIRAQIVDRYQREPHDEAEYYECTMHWDNAAQVELTNAALTNGQTTVQNESFDGQASENGDNGVDEDQTVTARPDNRILNGEVRAENGTLVGMAFSENGYENGQLIEENGSFPNQASGDKGLTDQEVNLSSNEQASPDGEEGSDVKFPPAVKSQTVNQSVIGNSSSEQTQVVNGKPVHHVQGSVRNNVPAQVPISETMPKEVVSAAQRNMQEQEEVGLSGFVSVRDKQYITGSRLKHPHGPIAQPASAVIESITESNDEGQGRTGEEGDDEDTLLKTDPVDGLLSQLRITNPEMFQTLLQHPEALENLARSEQTHLTYENRPSEPQLSQPLSASRQRPANSCTREVTQRTGLLTNASALTVDEFSGQSPSQQGHPFVPVTTQPPTAGVGPVANTVRMHVAPSSAMPHQAHQSVSPGMFAAQNHVAPVVTAYPQQTVSNSGSKQTATNTGSQQMMNNAILCQQVRPPPAQTFIRPSLGVPIANRVQPTHFQTPVVPVSRQEQTVRPQAPGLKFSTSSAQPGPYAEHMEQLPRQDETSGRQDPPPIYQSYTGAAEENRARTTQSDTNRGQRQPVTIHHKHAGGGLTTITMDPDNELPPNLQIGNKNVMVVNDSGRKKKSEKKKKKKCDKSQLPTCTDELSMDHIDMVSVEIGKDWKRLCRQLDMTEADIEQLQFDFYSSGLYEIMYQGIQKWLQRNGRAANVKKMAEALWEIDRDDIALRLHRPS